MLRFKCLSINIVTDVTAFSGMGMYIPPRCHFPGLGGRSRRRNKAHFVEYMYLQSHLIVVVLACARRVRLRCATARQVRLRHNDGRQDGGQDGATRMRLFFEIWQKRWGARESAAAAVGVPPKAFDFGNASQKVNRVAAGASRRDADWKRPGRSRSRFQRHGSGEGSKLR